MASRIEVGFKEGFSDTRGLLVTKRIKEDLGIHTVSSCRVIDVYKINHDLTPEHLRFLGEELFADPIIQEFSYNKPFSGGFDVNIEVGFKEGVADTVGNTASCAIKRLLGIDAKVYTSRRFLVTGDISPEEGGRIACDLLANEMIQKWSIAERVDFSEESYLVIPEVKITHKPTITHINVDVSDLELMKISNERSLALNLVEMKVIKDYFLRPEVINAREAIGLDSQPTDAELEVLGQTWSEHCKHKIFNARVTYTEEGKTELIDSLFETYIKSSTEQLKNMLSWVVSVLWDNSGVIQFNDEWLFCFKCETHNSPSNKEPYGGAITGIVGVYRDPMGTGMGCKLIYGTYGFCTGYPDYNGSLKPTLHPRRLLEGVRKGVEDGGNKHGVPTPYGITFFDDGYMSKPALYVLAAGLIPAIVGGEAGYEKRVEPGDRIVMCGGRVGIDGIHGATESSMEAGEWITLGHVQMGDPFTQKKMHDFLNEARDRGLYRFIQDNGAGGLSSSVGETARFSNGFFMDLGLVPLKYAGLDPWQILLSESQERMTLAVPPDTSAELKRLAEIHEVEITDIGHFTETGKFHVAYGERTVTYMDMDFVHQGVPQMQLSAQWIPPQERGLYEPHFPAPRDHTKLLKEMLARPNICSKEYITRQFDHEVQGTSVIKHLVGEESDVYSDAVVIRPLLDSHEGIAIAAGINPKYSRIDTYHMAACCLDEGIRRIIAVGGRLEQMVFNDNFCWPSPLPSENNPDSDYKMAQLVRANKALYDYTMEFGTPCIAGKDSMSMDGEVKDTEGKKHRISAPPTLQFSGAGKISDVRKCVTMDVKSPGDLVYILGLTQDELGGSEYYELQGVVGLHVPRVNAKKAKRLYQALSIAIEEGLVESCHGCYRGGLAVALAQAAFAGGYGMEIDLRKVPREGSERDDTILYSESASRFVVTISPKNKKKFEKIIEGNVYGKIGSVLEDKDFKVIGVKGGIIIQENIESLKEAWKAPFSGK